METMPVYTATLSGGYCGGLIVIAANSAEEALAAMERHAAEHCLCGMHPWTEFRDGAWRDGYSNDWKPLAVSELLAPAGPPRVLYVGAYAE